MEPALDSDVTQLVQNDLQQFIEDGKQKYKLLMDDLLKHLQPFKESQLLQYHYANLQVILKAFDSFYDFTEVDALINESIKDILTESKHQLETLIHQLFEEEYLKKHDTQTLDVVKQVKQFTNEAEALYNLKVHEFNSSKETSAKDELTERHELWKVEAFSLFHSLQRKEKELMVQEEFWTAELTQKLKERFDELNEECLDEIPIKSGSATDPDPIAAENLPENSWTVKESSEDKTENDFQSPSSASIINIGIYIDKTSFKIGTYDDTGVGVPELFKHFQQLISIFPELYFHEDKIHIGDQAKFYRYSKNSKYFNIFEILTHTKAITLHQICLNNEKPNLCDHEIIALFLSQVLTTIEQKFRCKIGKIIFTFSFTPTSAMKERLHESARVAGLKDFRILSSLLTMGIAGLDILQYYLNSRRPSMTSATMASNIKSIFVFDYTKDSFSMGIVEVRPTGINLLNPYGSENIIACQEEDFICYHHSLYHGFEISEPMKDYIVDIYKNAINYVFKAKENASILKVCSGVSRNKSTMIESIVLEILQGRISSFNTFLGPLAGASMLATLVQSDRLDFPLSVFSQRVRVQDAGRSSLRVVTSELTQKYRNIQSLFGKAFHESQMFVHKINVVMTNNSEVHLFVYLDELFGCKETNFDICCYQITCKSSSKAISKVAVPLGSIKVEIEVQCEMDPDGVFTLHFSGSSNFPVVIDVMRQDTLNCNSGCKHPEFTGFDKLAKLYK